MAGSRPPGEKRHDEDTLNASRRLDVSKYDPFWEPPPDERQAAWNKIAEAVEAYSVSADASTLASLLREEAIVHFYMAEALERITDDPHQKSRAIEIKRSEAAQVEPFPQRAVISEANYEQIRELVETGRRESVWEAFHTNPSLASDLIAEDAKIDQTLRQAADSTLTFLLQAQARVQLSMALALARIAEQPQQKSRAIEVLLDEAAQLTDRETICPALRSLKSFEPLAVIPSLIAFLGKARDGPVRDAAFETFEHLILHGFAAYDSDPAAARRGRDLTLRFFVAILGAAALDEPERVMVAGIVLRCAEILGSGLDAVIGRMAQLSNVTVEEMGLRICGRVLASPDSHAAKRAEAVGWVLRHLSGEHAGIPIGAFASQSSAAPTSEGSVESPRVPIHPSLTDTPSPEQTSPVRMDTSQEVSPGPTAAPSLNLDLSSHQFTTNGEGNGFSPARSDAIPTGVHTDQLDLSSVSFSFTTEDPAVLRTRMLLVSQPASEDLSPLDVFKHGLALLKLIHKHQRLFQGDVQAFLDRLHTTDLTEFSIPQKKELAGVFNAVKRDSGLDLLHEDARTDGGNPTPITNLLIDIPNERSKGSVRVWSGRKSIYTGRMWPSIIANVPVEPESPLSSPED